MTHLDAVDILLIKDNPTIVEDLKTAEAAYMPKAALEATQVDHALSLSEIGKLLLEIPRRAFV